MTSNYPVNGASMNIALGVEDVSTRVPIVEPEAIPSHCPKVWIFAAKGKPGVPQLTVGGGREQLFGASSFDELQPWCNHQTILSNKVNAEGNAQMIERVIPADAGPKANFILWLDVLATDIIQYQRDSRGRFIVNEITGNPIPVVPAATLPGFKAKWVVTSIATNPLNKTDLELFGNIATTPGDQTDGQEQSTRYPIMAFWADAQGSWYSNSGVRLWAPTENTSGAVVSSIVTGNKAFPLRMSVIRRQTATQSARIVNTQAGAPYVDFTLKPNQLNNILGTGRISLGNLYPDQYQELKDARFQPLYADLSGFKLYQDNIDDLLAQFYAAEKDNTDSLSDWTAGAIDEKYLFNMFSGVSTQDGPYYTFQVDHAAANSVRLSEATDLFAQNGSDGTMTNATFAALVETAVAGYADESNPLAYDVAYHVESIVYDTGFPLSTKYALTQVLAHRKDIGVVLSTYQIDGQSLSAAEDHSVAVALRTRAQQYPESDYFGTPIFRCVIFGRDGVLRDSNYQGRLPLSIELATMAAKMMGASNGVWDSKFIFDSAPNNEMTMFDDVSIASTPYKQRNKDWDVGLNYPLRFTRKTLYFPALKTVYNNDTSILNSFFVMMGCIECQKVGDRVHRQFSGNITLSAGQFIDNVNKEFERRTIGRFANLFKIVPACVITAADEARGYSWHLPVKFYANPMKTAQIFSIHAHRMSDLSDTSTTSQPATSI